MDHYTTPAAKPYSPKPVDCSLGHSLVLPQRSSQDATMHKNLAAHCLKSAHIIYNSSKPYIPVSQLNAI